MALASSASMKSPSTLCAAGPGSRRRPWSCPHSAAFVWIVASSSSRWRSCPCLRVLLFLGQVDDFLLSSCDSEAAKLLSPTLLHVVHRFSSLGGLLVPLIFCYCSPSSPPSSLSSSSSSSSSSASTSSSSSRLPTPLPLPLPPPLLPPPPAPSPPSPLLGSRPCPPSPLLLFGNLAAERCQATGACFGRLGSASPGGDLRGGRGG